MNISLPNQQQLIHGAERVLAVFSVAAMAYLKVAHDPLSQSALHGALLAGGTAVYQLVLSTLTEL
jgi:hypothetical protein